MLPPRPSSDRGFIGQVSTFLGVSALAGVLIAGMLMPLVGSVGLSARSTAQAFTQPQQNLDLQPLAQRSRILAADGKTVLAELYDENRISVPLTAVAPVMRQAILAIEDSRFYQHGGVDIRGTLRAAATNAQSGGVVQGGSTLTQQLTKNVLVDQARNADQIKAARERGLARKFRELQYAIQVEKELSKDQILENYLNIVYFGSGTYGIEAAARHYFSTSASNLTLPEAALLAGVVRSPSAYAPTTNLTRATARRNTVLDRMAQLTMITPAQATQAKQTKITLRVQRPKHGCAAAKGAAFFCDYVTKVIKTDPVFGSSTKDRETLLDRGGLNIVTTLDPKMQQAAQQSVDRHVYPTDAAAAAISLVEPGTGAIKAMAQSRPYGSTGGLNLNVDKQYGQGNGFQAGSTFKPFVAASALEQGIPASTAFDSPLRIELNGPFRTCDRDVKDPWRPSNETAQENGRYDMAGAMAKSVNTYFAQLEQRTGICGPKQLAQRLGLFQANGRPLQEVKTFTLGISPVAPLDMAEAYATFAARGRHCDTVAILSVTDRTGRKLDVPQATCENVLKPEIADTINGMLRGVVQSGTATSAQIGRPSAGKTGTTQNRVAIWFVGYTPNMAAAVWAGSPRDYTYHLVDKKIGPEFRRTWCGGCLPAPIWRETMSKALQNVPAVDFASGALNVGFPEGGERAPVPDMRGVPPELALAALRNAGFQPRISGDFVTSDRRSGTVAFTSPRAGERVRPGSTVTIFVSQGGQAVFNPPPPPPPPHRGGGGGSDTPPLPRSPRHCKEVENPVCERLR